MDLDFNNVQVVREVWRISRIILCTAGKETILRHKALVPAHINIEELHVKSCLLFDGLCNITARVYRVSRKVPKDRPDGTLFCTVPFFKGINHIVVSGLVVEVDEKRWIVLVMDFCDRAIFCPEIHPAVPVRRVNDPHLPSYGLRSGPVSYTHLRAHETRSYL